MTDIAHDLPSRGRTDSQDIQAARNTGSKRHWQQSVHVQTCGFQTKQADSRRIGHSSGGVPLAGEVVASAIRRTHSAFDPPTQAPVFAVWGSASRDFTLPNFTGRGLTSRGLTSRGRALSDWPTSIWSAASFAGLRGGGCRITFRMAFSMFGTVFCVPFGHSFPDRLPARRVPEPLRESKGLPAIDTGSWGGWHDAPSPSACHSSLPHRPVRRGDMSYLSSAGTGQAVQDRNNL